MKYEEKNEQYVDISMLGKSHLLEIAAYIKEDTLEKVNETNKYIPVSDNFYSRYGKRAFDIVFSSLAILITLPINLLIGIITYFDVGKPLFFKQTRIGKGRNNFYIYKFRNMTNDKDANGELLPPSQRVTKWGRFVRKTSLDELLNFVSIFKGDMSLIGPRPLIASYVDRLHDRHLTIYNVRPGLECPFYKQLDHAPTWQDRLDNYTWYAENLSFIVDVQMVLRMFKLVFSRESTTARSESKNGAFLGYDINGHAIDSNGVPQKYVNMLLEKHGYDSIEAAIEDRNNVKTA